MEIMRLEREVSLSIHSEGNGSMVIFEEGTVPFPVRRAFVVFAGAGQSRGDHAHRTCTQMLVVLRGSVQVTVNDGHEGSSCLLTQLSHGLLLPPMTWATQNYLTQDAILMVLCDQLFDEGDYIRDREEYISLINH
jgi:dTDP-4-dehydrorhamnose 3,5-epimerase-like enzyme